MGLGFKSWLFSVLVSKFLNVKDSKVNFTGADKLLFNVSIITDDGKRIHAYLFEAEETKDSTEFIIILHGTGSSRESYGPESPVQALRTMGYHLLVPDYRGFADSEGKFDVEGANLDILACFKYIVSRFGPRKIHVIGHSFGSAIAAGYCKYIEENSVRSEYHPDKIVLLSPFMSVLELLLEFPAWKVVRFVFPWLEEKIRSNFEYNTLENIKHHGNTRKIFIYHGKNDALVPYRHSLVIAERYSISLTPTEHNHTEIISDGSVWSDVYKNISEGFHGPH